MAEWGGKPRPGHPGSRPLCDRAESSLVRSMGWSSNPAHTVLKVCQPCTQKNQIHSRMRTVKFFTNMHYLRAKFTITSDCVKTVVAPGRQRHGTREWRHHQMWMQTAGMCGGMLLHAQLPCGTATPCRALLRGPSRTTLVSCPHHLPHGRCISQIQLHDNQTIRDINGIIVAKIIIQ